MKFTSVMMASVLPLAAAGAIAQGTNQPHAAQSAGTVISRQPVYTQAMQELQRSAQRLRESIQALAQQQPGPERDQAIDKAREALLETQQAMVALPPELRTSGVVSTEDYDDSVKKLMRSADSLRFSIQEMAQQPAGERRNRAIRQANQALWDTQVAMASAYQPQATRASGAGPAQKTDKAAADAAGPAAAPAVLVLLPAQVGGDAKLANGCWVRFFDHKNYRGDSLTLAGPVDMPSMELPGSVWRDWDSAIVGPKATITTFDNERFHDRTAVLSANQSVPDLRDKKLGWFEEVKSARVACG